MIHNKRRRVRGRQPRYHHRSLLRPMCSQSTTPWTQLLSCGTSSDFIDIINFERHVFIQVWAPLFEANRQSVNFGSSYKKGPKKKGDNVACETLTYILALVKIYIKISCSKVSISPIIGLEPSWERSVV